MNDREIMEAAIRHMKDVPIPVEDSRPFWVRLLASLRLSFKPRGLSFPATNLTGGATF